MPKLPVITAKQLIPVLEKYGFVFDRQKGNHRIFKHEERGWMCVVPVHSGKDIPPATLRSILKQAHLDVEELIQNL